MNNVLVLGVGPTDDINEKLVQQNKNLVLTFLKQIRNFSLSLHYNGDKSYLYVERFVNVI